jgi:heparanase 1
VSITFVLAGALWTQQLPSAVPQFAKPRLDPESWPHIATADEQYLSFNIEMAEVTGGEFWASYDDPVKRRLAPRAALDLNNPRLIRFARALSPAMVRVSGTWANSTHVPALNENALNHPPNGFRQVLTQPRWKALTTLVNASGNELCFRFRLALVRATPQATGRTCRPADWLG